MYPLVRLLGPFSKGTDSQSTGFFDHSSDVKNYTRTWPFLPFFKRTPDSREKAGY